MRIFYYTILLLGFVEAIQCQNTESSYWFIGPEDRNGNNIKSVSILDFSDDELNIQRREDISGISFLGNSSSISSSEGDLLFYSNGCFIFNQDHELMNGGNQINNGTFWGQYCSSGTSYPSGHASTMILPAPYKPDEYYLLHQRVEQFWPDEYSRLYYSKVDMSENGGLGRVVEKNQLILPDSTYLGEMAAVKHANGKDWWVVVPEDSNDVYNVLLLDSIGIRKSHEQKMGEKIGYFGVGTGQCKFSPDGKKFARWTATKQLYVADFDRITGDFSNFKSTIVQDPVFRGGIEFSPNNRFLYVSSGLHIDQFDFLANDLATSQITIAQYDGFLDVLPTEFRRMQLTSDCRIFINAPGDHRYWHVIQNPNEKGLDCNLEQHSLFLPTRTFNTLPYFPNYSLGPIGNEGYPCDSTKTKITFSSVEVPIFQQAEARVFPNPTTGTIQIDMPLNKGELNFQLLDMAGKIVFTKKSILPFEEIQLEDVANGMYFYKILDKKGRSWSGKVVVNQ